MMPRSRSIRMLMLVSLLLAGICALPVTAAEHTVAPAGAEYATIQEAVDWVPAGDTILVESGTYSGTVILNKRIILRGIDSGGGLPVIDAAQAGNGVDIRVDGCTVEQFLLRNGSLFTGINVESSDNIIRKNSVSGFMQGISLLSSQRSTIAENNIVESGRAGIVIEASDYNILENNSVTRNTIGITLDEYSLSNIISLNTFANSQNVVSKSITSQWSSPGSLSPTPISPRRNRAGWAITGAIT